MYQSPYGLRNDFYIRIPKRISYQSPYTQSAELTVIFACENGLRNMAKLEQKFKLTFMYQSPYGLRNFQNKKIFKKRKRVSIPVRVKEQQGFVFPHIIHHSSCFVKREFCQKARNIAVNQSALYHFRNFSSYHTLHQDPKHAYISFYPALEICKTN